MLSLFPLGYALLVKIKEFFAQNYDDEEACSFYFLPCIARKKTWKSVPFMVVPSRNQFLAAIFMKRV
jgi:hypothetical protein